MNRRGAAMGLVFGLPVTLAIASAASSGCSSTKSQPATLAQGCSLNSDCTSPLICVFSLCHDQCAASRDCPNGELCVSTVLPSCPPGAEFDGVKCLSSAHPQCPEGPTFDGKTCATKERPTCPPGMSFDGTRCVTAMATSECYDLHVCPPSSNFADGRKPS